MDPHFQVLRLRAQLFFSALEDLPEQRKQEPIDLITASNFNHLVDDLSSFYPSITLSLPSIISIHSLSLEPVSYKVLENLAMDIIDLIPEEQGTD